MTVLTDRCPVSDESEFQNPLTTPLEGVSFETESEERPASPPPDRHGSWVGGLSVRDAFEGEITNPQSLNKYLYTQGDPINYADPTGQTAEAVMALLAMISTTQVVRPEQQMRLNAERAASDTRRLGDYLGRLAAIAEKYQKKWPELYKAMGMDRFFTDLQVNARAQVRWVMIDEDFGEGAQYEVVSNGIWIGTRVNDVTDFTLVHESVHAWDDKAGWYLNSTYWASRRKAEALGYGSEYMLECFNSLLALRVTKRTLPAAEWQRSWNDFWDKFRDDDHDKYVTVKGWFFGESRTKLTNADLADVKQKLGLEVDYAKIASLFDLPPQ